MTLLQQPDTTRIRRLTIRGPSGTRQSLLPQLEASRWPAPDDGSWVLVRHVAASAAKSRLSNELLETVRRQIDSEDPSEVIRFSSLSALIAALITDLARGVASQHWYWQRWSRLWTLPAGDAIQQLMQEHPRQLVSVCHRLAFSGALIPVWQRLSADNGRAASCTLCYELGLDPKTLNLEATGVKADSPRIEIPRHQIKAWQSIFSSLPATDPRLSLAALIVATDSAALALRASAPHTLAMVLQSMVPPADHRSGSSVSTPDAVTNRKAGGFQDKRPRTTGDKPSVYEAAPPQNSLLESTSDSPSLQGGLEKVERSAQEATQDTSDTDRAVSTVYEQPENQSQDPHGDRVHTGMGGALYLLNVLNRPPIQAIMEQAWQSLPSGWAWLYRLARELDLDQGDALCEFLAERLGLESTADLESLPQLPERQAVLSLVAQWFSQDELWYPGLIRVPAELSHTPGHLDMYMDNSQVRLDVRLAGLDLNPGWLPWLGTVVTFHFDHFPHLQGVRS